MESSLAELKARLVEVDDKLALKLAEKDEAWSKAEALKAEAKALNDERDPIAREVSILEAAERAAAGGPPTMRIGGGESDG